MSAARPFAAGVLDGMVYMRWSHHATRALAERAARKYARKVRRESHRARYPGWDSGFVWLPDGSRVEVTA